MKLNELNKLIEPFSKTEKMPVLFLGHGSPMNAIEENEFVAGFINIAKQIPLPVAVLCVSAHWETRGTFVTAMEKPTTIHDFGGFPKELFQVQYPAPGSPQLAQQAKHLLTKTTVGLDLNWGLDHGAWSVIKHLYPKAQIPVIQLSLDYTQSPQYHYALAQQLIKLRNKGILIIGSGNIVHNLKMVALSKLNEIYAFDWAIAAHKQLNEFILDNNHQALINYNKLGKHIQMAIPTPEHYLPLLYALALKDKNDTLYFFNDKPVAGSLTMTSIKISA